MRKGTRFILFGGILLVGAYFLWPSEKVPDTVVVSPSEPIDSNPAIEPFVGREACKTCHREQYDAWSGSHHDLAMQLANTNTVLGDFDNASFDYHGLISTFYTKDGGYFVNTDGPDGELVDYRIDYTFGVYPLQQYMVKLDGGRVQVLSIAWDTREAAQGGQRWFHLFADEKITHKDELHWTGVNQNWNFMCAECHSTNLQKNFDLTANRYDTKFSEIDVSCEACHGPGSNHVELAGRLAPEVLRDRDEKGFAVDLGSGSEGAWQFTEGVSIAKLAGERDTTPLIEGCARCHSRRTTIDHGSIHQAAFHDTHLPSLLEPTLYHADGQIDGEVYVYGSFIQSKMYAAGVGCQDCHDVHSLELRAQGNGVCLQCHKQQTYETAEHHFHAADTKASECVSCHMVAKNFMVVDPRRDHSFRVPRPDLSVKTGAPNACNGCHTEQSPEWAVTKIEQWFDRETLDFHFGEAIFAGRTQSVEAKDLLQRVARDVDIPSIARASAIADLGQYPVTESLDIFRAGFRDPDPKVRTAALNALSGVGVRDRFVLGQALLTDEVKSVRITAAGLLAGTPRSDMTHVQQGQFDAAIQEYIEAQNENADRGFAHSNLATLYAALDDNRKAETAYRKSIEIEPAFIPAYVNLADLYRVQGDEARAEELLRLAISVNPEVAAPYHALGLALVRQKNYDDALSNFEQATTIEPVNAQYNYVYAVALNSLNRTQDALEVLESAHGQRPGNRQLLTTLITINRDRGDTSAAIGYAKKLSVLVPDDQGLRQLIEQLQQLQ